MRERIEGNCRAVRRLLPRRTDGELTGADARAVEEHLTHCAPCREEARRAEALLGVLHGARAPEAPLPSGAALVAAARALESADRRIIRPFWMRRPLPAAALAAGILAVALFWGLRPESPPARTAAPARAADPPVILYLVDDEEAGRTVWVAPAGTPRPGEKS